jgi:hypothetical protein
MINNVILNCIGYMVWYLIFNFTIPLFWYPKPLIAMWVSSALGFLLWNICHCIVERRNIWAMWGYIPTKERKRLAKEWEDKFSV